MNGAGGPLLRELYFMNSLTAVRRAPYNPALDLTGAAGAEGEPYLRETDGRFARVVRRFTQSGRADAGDPPGRPVRRFLGPDAEGPQGPPEQQALHLQAG